MIQAVLYGLTAKNCVCFFNHSACCLWPVKDKPALCFSRGHCRKIRGGIQFQLCTLTALFADSRDYESLALALPAFTNGSGKAHWGWGRRRRDGVKIVHFGDEQPQRGASSALGDRYLATGNHVAKTRSCLVFFVFFSHSLFHFHSHSNTLASLLCVSTPLSFTHPPSISPPPSLTDWSNDELTVVSQCMLGKLSFFICSSLICHVTLLTR